MNEKGFMRGQPSFRCRVPTPSREFRSEKAELVEHGRAQRFLCEGRNDALHRTLPIESLKLRKRNMDREHVKGAADKAKGSIKETAGKLTGDQEMQSEGQLDRAKGQAHKAAGNVKDAARDLTK